ncbi:MAG: DPP IV N-terminal domain-containing protein [Pseudomonadota bacterium]
MKQRIGALGAVILAGCASPALSQTEADMADPSPALTIERLYASPGLSGPRPRSVKYSPDGQRVTFLKARDDDGSRLDLWQFDVATGEPSLLVDSTLLEPEDVELSEEEKALRERKRIAGTRGIVSYQWGTADTILVPIGGDLWLVTLPPADGAIYTIEVDGQLAANYALSEADVLDQVKEASVGFGGVPLPPEDLRNLLLSAPDGSAVRLLSIAEIVPALKAPEVRQLTQTDAFEYDAKVSPGGRYVSFIRDEAVWAIDLETGEEQRLTPEAEPDKAIRYGVAEFVAQEEMGRYTGYWWSPDERYLAYTRVDESTVDIIPRYDIAAGETTVVEQRYPRAGRPNAVVDLFVRDMETGGIYAIDWRRDDGKAATDHYLARVNWNDTTQADFPTLFTQGVGRDQNAIFLTAHDVETGAKTELEFDAQDAWINLSSDLMPGTGTLQFGAVKLTQEVSGFRHIEALSYQLCTDGVTTERYVFTAGEWAVDEVLLDRGGTIWFTGYHDTPLERHLYRIDDIAASGAPAPGNAPQRITESGKSWSIAMAPDGQSFVGTSSSPDQPPQTGLYRLLSQEEKLEARNSDGGGVATGDTGCEDLLPRAAARQIYCGAQSELIAWIEENALDESHPYHPYLQNHTTPDYGTLTAEDGQTLHYSIQTPPDFDPAKQYPVLLNVYGGPGVQTVDRDWERLTDVFYTQQGYIVFRLDNRGTANRGKAFEDVIYRQMGIPEVRDQLLGVEWLKRQPFVDADRIAIQGWSYGGYMTLMTILQAEPGTFAAAVSGAPVTDWALYDTFYTERYMDTPQDNPEGYQRGSVFYHLDRYEGALAPLLLVHGMADDNVTFDNTTRLMAALQERGQTFDLMTYPGQRHGIRGDALGIHLMRTRMAFLDRHLKGE